jgi:DNA phosphorothioation-associated putative methyltransferase
MSIQRFKTAKGRHKMSKPMRLSLPYLGESHLDYGCGRGDDVGFLTDLGYTATGWDPHYFPGVFEGADTVSLFYVLNVIEYPAERVQVLKDAWSFCRQGLFLATRCDSSNAVGEAYSDGYLTCRNTSQHFYTHQELLDLVETHLPKAKVTKLGKGILFLRR